MSRERSPERDKVRHMWLESSGTMRFKDIAAALSVPESQVREWKNITMASAPVLLGASF
ncbi:phage terminase small subunit-related protein [Paenibacillus polymyxa]|uniref:phage terminase small subunit-related protein n=1 Tax=Paenibacillus polymyxa TaxID=1406 RepID=UPI0032165DD2